ncbi:hypothetical protein ACS127_02085 [Amphibacillus sp. Q70]|uniref:hypothetical protein n=1 Tax=Amphibacillus sp. Q70 TaxID=3453416 RepID=UPI003F834FE8
MESYNSNKVDEMADQADLILLTPTLGFAKEEIEKRFPKTPVIAISKKDYGILNADKIVTHILGLLNKS